ncbi:MAG: AAA family ATPase [Promethearchaeota archaeon]
MIILNKVSANNGSREGTTISIEIKNINIQKLILENFLSFQRDEINFGDSKFIIIIGPNWSGKTSIFQAIKFVLGSNERDERYKKWSDFIRNGQNHAMVEVHIQNNDELIRIRRSVIRGKSPFFEIKSNSDKGFKKVHANDIQELISNLGIIPDNQFAFVSQGKIDIIKSLKPIELCAFLEEGIGLKGLRDEILLQKRGIFNLNREFQTLVSRRNTLNINLNLLQPKIIRLKEKHKLLEEKKNFTDELLYANRQKLYDDITYLKEVVEEKQRTISEIQKVVENHEKILIEIESKSNDIELGINEFSKQLGQLTYKKRNLIEKIQIWEKEKVLAKKELDNINLKVSTIEKALKNIESKKKILQNENTSIKEEIDSIKTRIDDLIKEQNVLTKKLRLNEDFLMEYHDLTSKRGTYTKRIEEYKIKIKDINSEINEIFQSFNDIEHKLEKNKWFLENPTSDLLLHIDNEIKNKSKNLFELGKQLNNLQFKRTTLLERFKHLQVSLRERKVIFPPSITILKEEIERRELNKKVKGPIIEFLQYEDTLSYAIESILGERLLYSFVVNDWDTLNLLNKIKNKYNAYCNIYITKNLEVHPLPEFSADNVVGYLAELIKVVNNDKDIQKVIYSKVRNCLVVEDYHSAIQIYKIHKFKGKCVTLKGEQLVSYKYVYETPYQKRLKGLLSASTIKGELVKLESDIETMNKKISNLKVKFSNIDQNQKELYEKKEAFNDLLYNFNQKQRLTSKKNKLYELTHNLENNIIALQDEIKYIEEKILSLESQRDPKIFKLSNRIEEIPDELHFYNEDLKKWDKKLNENMQQNHEVNEKIAIQKEKLMNLKQKYEEKRQNFQNSDKKAFEIYKKLESIEDKIDEIENNILKLREDKLEIQKEKTDLEKEHIEIKIKLEQELLSKATFEQELLSNEKELERINSEIGALISKEEFKLRPIDDIKEDILRIDKELLKYLDVDDSILIEKEQILSSMKEIAKNQKSLEKDINSAIKTEGKLEETYFNKFKLTLNDLELRINQKFKSANIKSYCSLNLIGDFEYLGIDIKAATTKEQLKSFKALSGGQISMISICLILSLQEIKPSPLCMFDEAGMFLDDKNSEASYQMIKATLEQNPIQLLMFLPKSSSNLYLLADKLIGVARIGKKEVSTIFKPKILKQKEL